MLYIFLCFTSSIVTPGNVSSGDFPMKMEQFYNLTKGKTVSGAAVAISKDGEKIFEQSIGFDDLKTNHSASNETLYEWGSITKVFTHVAMFQLYEAGKVNLTEDIEVYLGNNFFSHRKYPNKITILNLMNHDAGWDVNIEAPIIPGNNKRVDLEKTVIESEPRIYSKPGERISYSNYGVTVEGLIIEKVSGQTYIDYIKTNILDKLGMNRTSIDPGRKDISQSLLDKKAVGYEPFEGKLREVANYSGLLYPAGSLLGPIGDLAIFANALTPVKGKKCPLFEKDETLNEFFTVSRKTAEGAPGIAHGLWQEYYTNRIVAYEHPGSTAGMTARLSIIPELGWNFVAVANSLGESSFCQTFLREIWGLYSPLNETKISKDIVGTYQSNRIVHEGYLSHVHLLQTSVVTLDEEKNQLLFDGTPFKRSEANLYSNANLILAFPPERLYHLNFLYNDKGEVDGLYTYCMGFRKMKEGENDRLKLFMKIIDICPFLAISPIVLLIIACAILNKRLLKSRHLKHMIFIIILCVSCVAESLVMRSTREIKTYVNLRRELHLYVIILDCVIGIRVSLILLILILAIIDCIKQKKRDDAESMVLFEPFNQNADESNSSKFSRINVRNLCTNIFVYCAIILSFAICALLVCSGVIVDIYRL